MEFSADQWTGLKEHAEECGLLFLSSAFSVEAVDLLDSLGMKFWKVASGELESDPLLDAMIETGKPIWLSSGMSNWKALDRVVERVRKAGNDLLIFQCTTMYPTPAEKVGLNVLGELRDRYGCPVGLSDHSGTIYPGLAACSLGAAAVEVHVTFSRQMFGPDGPASLEMDELSMLVNGVRFIREAQSNPVDKDAMSVDLGQSLRIFSKSVTLRRDLPAGSELTEDVVAFRKPGTGIPASRWSEVRGRRTSRDLERYHVLEDEDLADE
jgi:N-acetylneuraminate synthase